MYSIEMNAEQEKNYDISRGCGKNQFFAGVR